MKSFASARRKTEQVVLLALRLGDALVDALALLQQLVDLELELIVALALLARQLPITLARRLFLVFLLPPALAWSLRLGEDERRGRRLASGREVPRRARRGRCDS
jgi:hypothetical protein